LSKISSTSTKGVEDDRSMLGKIALPALLKNAPAPPAPPGTGVGARLAARDMAGRGSPPARMVGMSQSAN
jgi:hypothetical protein